MLRLTALALISAVLVTPVQAEVRSTIGYGRLFTNDFIGDGDDRWRTGSFVFSIVTAPLSYDGTPGPMGEVLEYRLRAEIIAASLESVSDRPFVGALSLGVHTHFGYGPTQFSLGADVVAIGPQTGLDVFQDIYHDAFSLPPPGADNVLPDAFHVNGTAALSETFRVNETVTLRPFAEAHIGTENLLRVGGDVIIGEIGQNDLMLRDVVTGQLYRGTTGAGSGLSYVLGADIAAVGESVFLPTDQGYIVSDTRMRARGGVFYQMSEDVSFFYGMAYLSEEFEGQPEGQLLGSLKLNFNF